MAYQPLPHMTLVKVKLVKNQTTYFPRPADDTYFGIVFDDDEEHLRLKCFSVTIDHRVVFGTLNRFIHDDIVVYQMVDYDFR
jgi:hypothetical protein